MKAEKILFPTDFSTCSDAAFDTAVSLARDTGAKLLIVHVEEPTVAYGGGIAYYGVPDPGIEEQRRMLEKLVPADARVAHEHHLISGAPADAIVRFAQQEGVDLIVISTHGRTGLRRALMGSVSEAVVRQAHCPVLTLRQAEQSE